MATKEFDKKFTDLIEDAVHHALEYTDYSSEIDCVFIYISLEWGEQYFVFFRINGVLSFQHKLNEYVTKSQIDVSDDNQTYLNEEGNALAEKIKACFQEDEREVPTHLKITYEREGGKLNCKIGYDNLLDAGTIDELDVFFRWFAEEGGTLEPWMKAIL